MGLRLRSSALGSALSPAGFPASLPSQAGYAQSVALKSDGTVVIFGLRPGTLTTGSAAWRAGLTGATAVAAGVWHSVALITPLSQTYRRSARWGGRRSVITTSRSRPPPPPVLTSRSPRAGSCSIDGARVHLRRTGLCAITATQGRRRLPPPRAGRDAELPVAPAPCRVPRVVGMRLSKAKRIIAKRHCRTGKVRRAYRPRHRGVVISQSRRPGLKLPPGAKIKPRRRLDRA